MNENGYSMKERINRLKGGESGWQSSNECLITA